MIEGLKPGYNRLLAPVARTLMAMGVRPNHLTIAGVALFSVAGWLAFRGHWISAAAMVVVGSTCDGLDGLLARLGNATTAFGAILDSTCDRVTEIVLLFGLLGFYLTCGVSSLHSRGILLCYIAVTLSILVSYVKARCESMGISCSRGLLQRPERIILIGLGLLLGPAVMIWILGILSVLAAFTVGQRIVEAGQKAAKR